MEISIKKSETTSTLQELKNLRFDDYQEYFYFINDLSTKVNDYKMLVAGLLKRDKGVKLGYRCLNFDEFKDKLLNRFKPATF